MFFELANRNRLQHCFDPNLYIVFSCFCLLLYFHPKLLLFKFMKRFNFMVIFKVILICDVGLFPFSFFFGSG
jgi:hypothetical protein